MQEFLATVMLRPLAGLGAAAPTLLVGIAAAAILRAMVPAESVRRLFGEGGRGGPLRPLLLAALLPVDSLGVLPVLRELHRVGVPLPRLVTFALAAPLLGPLTLMYALTALGFLDVLTLVAAAVIASLLGGWLTSRWTDRRPTPDVAPLYPAVSSGRRMANMLVTAGRICVPGVLVDLLIGLGAAGLAATLIDAHGLSHVLPSTGPLGVPIMSLVGLPAYVAPPMGVMQVSGMAAMHLSLAASMGLYVFGVGQNAALCVWIARRLGSRRLALLGLVVLASTWAVGLTAETFLGQSHHCSHDHEQEHEDHAHGCCGHGEHNHALDGLGRYEYGPLGNPIRRAFRFTSTSGLAALAILGIVCIGGLVFRIMGIDVREESGEPRAAGGGFFARPIPGRWLGGCAVALLAAVGVLGVYIYYPPLDELFTQMTFVRANAVLAVKNGPRAVAMSELEAWNELAAKIETSALLRGQPTSDEARHAADELRRNLSSLSRFVAEGSDADPQRLLGRTMTAYDRCRWIFVQR